MPDDELERLRGAHEPTTPAPEEPHKPYSALDDWKLLYDPYPDGPPPVDDPGPVSPGKLLFLLQTPTPDLPPDELRRYCRRLAQEVLRARWSACEARQGSE